jgi:hypothetical protein
MILLSTPLFCHWSIPLREKFFTAEFEWCRQKLLVGKWKENSQIFNENFYLPLYLPLWVKAFLYCVNHLYFISYLMLKILTLKLLLLLKVHKIEIFFGFDFEICKISLIVMSKY